MMNYLRILLAGSCLLCNGAPAFANFAMSPSGAITLFAVDAANQGTALCAAASTECAASVPINTAGAPLFVTANPGVVSQATAANLNATVRNLGNAGAITDFAGQNAASPANAWLMGGQFQTTPTTISAGNASPLQLDNAGNLLVNIKAGAGSGGTALADGATFTQGTTSETPIGCLFINSYTAITTGKIGVVSCTSAGSVHTTVDNTNANLATNADAIAAVGSGSAGAGSPVNSANYVYNGTTWDRMPGTTSGVKTNTAQINGVTPLMGNGVSGTGSQRVNIASDNTAFSIISSPSSASGNALTGVTCGSAVSSCVLKNAAGNFYGVYAECTSACWLMVFNSTSAPSNGATTAGTASGNLVECVDVAANSVRSVTYPVLPANYSVGITAAISSTACATLTLSTVGFIRGTVL